MADAPARAPRSNLPKILIALAAVAALVVILLVTGVIGGGDDDEAAEPPTTEEVAAELREGLVLAGPREAPFAIRYTNDWVPLERGALERGGDEAPIAGLERKDGTGVITIALRGPIRGGIGSVEERLPGELASRIPDFELATNERITVPAGPALYTSWRRRETGRLQSQLVVPVSNKSSFTVSVVLEPDATEAAAESGVMLRTFDTAPAR